MEIGEEKSLLSQIIGKNAEPEIVTTPEPVITSELNDDDNIEIKQDSLLSEIIGNVKSVDTVDYKSQYDENIKSGKWIEVDGADDIEWNESSFKAIEEAQTKSTDKEKEENDVAPINIDPTTEVGFRQGRIEALNREDFNNVETAKEMYVLYRVREEGEEMTDSITKQMGSLSDDELVKYAKTFSAKIISEDEAYIKSESDKKEAADKAQQDNWNRYETSVVDAGSKMKIPANKSKEKLEKIKNGEFNKQFWAMISDPEKFHKVFDFISDIDKYEKKIEAKTNSKLIVEAITKKNINTETPKTNFSKINIPI